MVERKNLLVGYNIKHWTIEIPGEGRTKEGKHDGESIKKPRKKRIGTGRISSFQIPIAGDRSKESF